MKYNKLLNLVRKLTGKITAGRSGQYAVFSH